MFKLSDKPLLKVEELKETTLIDKLLSDQKKLTAIERFSQKHESLASPAQAEHYKDLIPIRKPSTGEQYSFSVDLDKCTGCKACVVACHSRNGLDETESWRDVGKIISPSTNALQTVTTTCHHCADPACLSGCPVKAYEKMPDTGIVRHLDDQCIGCEYCSLTCPYDVPKYNKDLGIVRKCDMCHDRLAEGEAPACVQSCPNGAIKIELVETKEIYANAEKEERIIAGAFNSNYTFPSTKFISRRGVPADMKAVDEESIEASHKHTPLSWMLMLTQVSVGLSLVACVARGIVPSLAIETEMAWLIGAVLLGMIGLGASLLHLGSPFGAWRVFLGLKTSWLSREVVMFGAWMPALKVYLGLLLVKQYQEKLPIWIPEVQDWMILLAGVGASALGLASVFCSIMVYAVTKRDFWKFKRTVLRFGGTMLTGGLSASLLIYSLVHAEVPVFLLVLTAVAWFAKIGIEGASLLPVKQANWSTEKKSALIQLVTLRQTLLVRGILFTLLAVASVCAALNPVFAIVGLLALLVGEWLAKQLFFQAVETLKMPGNLRR